MNFGDVFILLVILIAILVPILFVGAFLDYCFSKHYRKCPHCGADAMEEVETHWPGEDHPALMILTGRYHYLRCRRCGGEARYYESDY